MSQPNPSFGELASVTINKMSKTAADNITQQNAVLREIEKSGNVDEVDGGLAILETIEFANNVNAGSYSGYDILSVAAQDVLTSASFPIKQYSAQVIFNGLEEMENAGKEKIIDVVQARVKNAYHSLENLINTHLYLDGTGNSGKNITGLNAAVPLSPSNTYGGINRSTSTNAFWKNQKFQSTVDGSGVATSTTIQGYWNTFIIALTRGMDKPTVIIAGPSVYSIFESSLQAIQRVTDSETASAGFKTLEFQGIPVVFDSTAAGITTTDCYFLNTDFLKWRPHKDRNMVALEDKWSMNQDATVKTIVWAGNLTCNASFLQGRYSNT